MAGGLRIAIGADHGGFILKEKVKKHLEEKGFLIEDFGTNSIESCDYPLFGRKVAESVSGKGADYGIVICKTGFGMAIAANKFKGVRCAVCDNVEEAESARMHNACNVLSLAAKRVTPGNAVKIVDAFLSTDPEGGRHQRRVDQITEMETKN